MQIWKGATLLPNEHKLIKNMHTTQLSRLVHSLLLEPTSYSSPVQPCCLFIFFLNLDGKMGGRGPGNEPAGLLPPKQSAHCVSIFTQIP